MSIYTLKYTDSSKLPIFVYDETLDSKTLDIILIGQSTAEYGQELDENILHLMEHFAAPEAALIPGTPNLSESVTLKKPTEGQMWFNKTQLRLFVYTGIEWSPMLVNTDVSANSGVIAHGQQIPLPADISSYDQCSWIVSPQYVDQEANYIECYTDGVGTVYSRYRPLAQNVLIDGLANYMIVGNINANPTAISYPLPSVPLVPSNTPTPTPTITVSPTSTPIAGVTVTPTVTRTPTPTSTVTPTVTSTPTTTPTRTPTPTPSVTPSQHVFTFSFTADLNKSNVIYIFGYDNKGLDAPSYGNMIPKLLSGYYISTFIQIVAGSTIGGNISLNLGITTLNGASGPPNNLFTSISFVDNTGTYRTFNVSDSTIYNTTNDGNNVTTWVWDNNSGVFFNQGNTYILLITE